MLNTIQTALITGASSGIGAAYAEQLAAQGYHLVLVARRRERLEKLATTLHTRYRAGVEVLVADLTDQVDRDRVVLFIQEHPALELLINNAGFGTSGSFSEIDIAKQLDMIQLHVVATVQLCRAALPAMIARHRGYIVNVSSIAAFLPNPGNVTYAATKRYMVTFSQALQTELAHLGVRVQALCPGFTYTEFHDSPEYSWFDRTQVPSSMWMSSAEVVTASLGALQQQEVVFIPGIRNRILVWVNASRLLRDVVRPVVRLFRIRGRHA